MHGSCYATTLEEAEGRKDCDPTIEARTPSQLKTKLASKIRQILAEKLAFTAPSITASVQEGGSLYQAQFEYEQYGEWRGTIKRREITGTGEVFIEHENNWDAGDEILKQTKNGERNYWSRRKCKNKGKRYVLYKKTLLVRNTSIKAMFTKKYVLY